MSANVALAVRKTSDVFSTILVVNKTLRRILTEKGIKQLRGKAVKYRFTVAKKTSFNTGDLRRMYHCRFSF